VPFRSAFTRLFARVLVLVRGEEITWRKECGVVMRQLKRRKNVCEAHLEAERIRFRRREFLWAIKRGTAPSLCVPSPH
jgi:hypothetical protein